MILQSDPAWATARLAHVTASRICDVMAKTKSGPAASRANYAAELVAERLTGVAGERFVSAAMQWGLDTEAQARAAYEFLADASTGKAAFILHPTIAMAGATPDGFVGEDGLAEFKCPQGAAHIEALLTKSVPSKYVAQVQWQMACTGRAWTDYVSFNPLLPARMQMFVKRVTRDDEMIGTLEREVEIFLAEIDDTIKRLTRDYAEAA